MKKVRVEVDCVLEICIEDESEDEEAAALAEQIALDCLYHGANGELRFWNGHTVFDSPQDGVTMVASGISTLEVYDAEEDE